MDTVTPNNAAIVSTAIYSLLSAVDLNSAIAFRQLYSEPQDQSIDGQIAYANRFWRNQIAHLDCATARDAKMALQDNVDLHDWIRCFSLSVAPVIVQNELPTSYMGRGLADTFDVKAICDSLLMSCTPMMAVI